MDKLIMKWSHQNREGEVFGEIHRLADELGRKKDIPYYNKDADGKFVPGIPEAMKKAPYPLLGLETLKDKTKPVYVVEGQKKEFALKSLGYQCVTSILGALNADKSDWSTLDEYHYIYLLLDNDEPGERYGKTIYRLLSQFQRLPTIQVVRLPNLPKKGDVCDWLRSQPELTDWDEVASLEEHSQKDLLRKRLDQVIVGSLEDIPITWQENEWPEQKPLQRALPKADEFPTDALGGILGNAAKQMYEIIQAPLGICAQSVLAGASLATQAFADVCIDGRQFPVSEYFFTVGESGSRKTAADRAALKAHYDYQAALQSKRKKAEEDYLMDWAVFETEKDKILKSKKASKEEKKRLLTELGFEPQQPLSEIIIVEEPSYEGLTKLYDTGRPSLAIISDEGGRFLGGYAFSEENQIKTACGLSNLWDGKGISRIRVKDGASLLLGRRLSFHLMTQPIISQAFLANSTLLAQGLVSRCLVTYPESLEGNRHYKEVDLYSQYDFKKYYERIGMFMETPPPLVEGTKNQLKPRPLSLHPDAKALWIVFHNSLERELKENGALVPIKGFANKAAEHALRLAGILTLVENVQAGYINIEAVKSGIRLTEYYINEALRLFSIGQSNEWLDLAERLWNWLKKQGKHEITLVEIYQYSLAEIREAKKAREVMKILEEHGYAVPLLEGAVFNGIHRSEAWRIKI